MAVDARGNEILSYGAKSGTVSWLKEVMGWWGYYDPTHPDAQLGADTYGWDIAEAVQKFQTKYGLGGAGTTDQETWYYIQQLAAGVPEDQLQRDTAPAGGVPGPATPTAPRPNPAAPGSSPDITRDAMARLGSLLRTWGLSGMEDWIRSKLIAGASEAEVQLELYERPEFKARFPAIAARQAAGLNPVSPAEILEYETRGRELLRRAGITSEALTNRDYLQNLMTQDVSLAEVQDRLNDGLLRVQDAPPEVRNAFGSYFGVQGDVALAQFFLDPAKAAPELEKMASTAMVGGIATRYNVHLAQQIAREVADTGVSDAAVWANFQKLDSMKSLFDETLAETTDYTAEQQGVGAVFGTQPGQEQALQRRAQSRTSQFSGGGGAVSSDRGVVGLGVADG